MMKSLSKLIVIALLLSIGLTACGKKPSSLVCHNCEREDAFRSYPTY